MFKYLKTGMLLSTLIPSLGCASQIERVIATTQDKVVKIGIITTTYKGTCSGAYISPDGLVLTCAHCFDDANIKKVFIKNAKGQVYKAELLKIDTKRDLALLAATEDVKVAFFLPGRSPQIGQQVISLGSPLGIQGTATVGYVTNLIDEKGHFIVHSAFVNPGNSGGPLIDLQGRLIGINEAMLNYGFFQQAHGLYIAISVPTIKEFLK